MKKVYCKKCGSGCEVITKEKCQRCEIQELKNKAKSEAKGEPCEKYENKDLRRKLK